MLPLKMAQILYGKYNKKNNIPPQAADRFADEKKVDNRKMIPHDEKAKQSK